jgi:hypothetical protein
MFSRNLTLLGFAVSRCPKHEQDNAIKEKPVDRMSHLCGLVREDQNVYFNPDWMFRGSLALLKRPK